MLKFFQHLFEQIGRLFGRKTKPPNSQMPISNSNEPLTTIPTTENSNETQLKNSSQELQQNQSFSSMKTIHSLFIAIDQYPIPAHCLRGCKNDALAWQQYLADFAKANGLKFNSLECFDAAANRKGVIDAFAKHFENNPNINAGDICTVFYSGHGAQMSAPPEFWDESDGKSETLVLHDSRIAGGRDMADKEFGYLLYKSFKNKNAHVLVVTDCCHSGENTRDTEIRPRMADACRAMPTAREYLGFEEYEHTEDGIFAPLVTHTHFAAARNEQTAKEMSIAGKPRGVFTATLIETLNQTGPNISYGELIERVAMRVTNRVKEQDPQLETLGEDTPNIMFLGNGTATTKDEFILNYADATGWRINAGEIHGVQTNSEFLLPNKQKIIAAEATAAYSVASAKGFDINGLDKKQQYRLQFVRVPKLPTKIAIDPKMNPQQRGFLENTIKNNVFPSLKFAATEGEADVVARELSNNFILTKPLSDVPMFRRVPMTDEAASSAFLSDTLTVARWKENLAFRNPKPSNLDTALKIEVLDEFSAPQKLEKQSKRFVFRQKDAKTPIKLQVKITNNSDYDLWISAVYFASDFQVTNKFLQKRQLKIGETAFVEYFSKKQNKFLSKLPLAVPDEFMSWGINEISETFKVFASTDEFETDYLNQAGLPLDAKTSTKRGGIKEDEDGTFSDWQTFDVNFSVVCPLPSVAIAGGSKTRNLGVAIEAPANFSANLSLSSTLEAKRALDGSESEMKPLNVQNLSSIALGESWEGSPTADMIELESVNGSISKENPLKISLSGVNEPTLAMAYDEKTGLWYVVGGGDNGNIVINTMPQPSVTTRSLGGSLKIFFKKLVLSKFTNDYEYPLLRLAQFKSDLSGYEYVSDNNKISEAIKKAERILVFIHGIIGDTLDMPNCLLRMTDTEGGVLAKDFVTGNSIALTFDYESLSTPIEQTAKDLEMRLAALGITEGHQKRVELVAHSMGGLVSRHFIEKLNGSKVVSRLIQLGTPNGGSEWSNAQELAQHYLTLAVNGSILLSGWVGTLTKALGWIVGKTQLTLQQMHPEKSKFLQALNDGSDPLVPYAIIVGNTSLISLLLSPKASFLQKVMSNITSRGIYGGLEKVLFKAPNDIAVRVESISGIPNMKTRRYPPQIEVVASDHLSYFVDEASLKVLSKILQTT